MLGWDLTLTPPMDQKEIGYEMLFNTPFPFQTSATILSSPVHKIVHVEGLIVVHFCFCTDLPIASFQRLKTNSASRLHHPSVLQEYNVGTFAFLRRY